jgi:hypothetical protein
VRVLESGADVGSQLGPELGLDVGLDLVPEIGYGEDLAAPDLGNIAPPHTEHIAPLDLTRSLDLAPADLGSGPDPRQPDSGSHPDLDTPNPRRRARGETRGKGGCA